MLRIDRLRIEILTEDGVYGFDERFYDGLNFLSSESNTWGKSSIIEGIYYCMGFEEIIGGTGEKVLTAAYKTYIENGDKHLAVLESRLYLQISNGQETITLYRTAKMSNRDSKLITVYYSDMSEIHKDVLREDTYVHMSNSANNNKGFHKILEDFLHLELPNVLCNDGAQRKLYLQLIFSCMFIEQKHGWGDIFSGMPYLGIKDAKKRVLEFVLKLNAIQIEKEREVLKNEENRIHNEWKSIISEMINNSNKEDCRIVGMPTKPQVLLANDILNIHILKHNQSIDEYINHLKEQYDKIDTRPHRVLENFDELQEELINVEDTIKDYESDMVWLGNKLRNEKNIIKKLNEDIEIIDNDLRNNKDAARIRDLGSNLNITAFQNICPLCQQAINDSLIIKDADAEIMSIDQNIKHLEAQKKMLNYAKEGHSQTVTDIDSKLNSLQSSIFTLRRLAKALRNDLYSVDESVSEALVHKKIELQLTIDKLKQLQTEIKQNIDRIESLSKEWKEHLIKKSKLPQDKFSNEDKEKLRILKSIFIKNLKLYGYKSIDNMDDISISMENYLPIIENFDMKFDSSASDNIRGIWAYTLALMYVSINKYGNHPGVVIFDEPKQHSIVPRDMGQFFNSIIDFGEKVQIIIGITIEDNDTKKVIDELDQQKYHLIAVKNKAFQKL